MSNRFHWFWHAVLSVAATAFFAIAMGAFEQRDEARRLAKPTIEMRGATLAVSCPKPATPTAASPAPRQERFVL